METCRLERCKKGPRQPFRVKESSLLHGVGSVHIFEHLNTNDK